MTIERRTVRELGGELWSEISAHIPESEADWEVKNRIVELAMGVLARHIGAIIENDEGLAVVPLPTSKRT